METYKFCQSCGFPLEKDKNGGGSEKDGSQSNKYCSMCYQKGEFLSPKEIDTPQKMQKFCIREMKNSELMESLHCWLPVLFQRLKDGKEDEKNCFQITKL